jgi:hypothetical protein
VDLLIFSISDSTPYLNPECSSEGLYLDQGSGTVNVTGCRFEDLRSGIGYGGAISIASIYIDLVLVRHCVFQNCSATEVGGGIFCGTPACQIEGTMATNCWALSGSFCFVYWFGNSYLTVNSTSAIAGIATYGAIYTWGRDSDLVDTEVNCSSNVGTFTSSLWCVTARFMDDWQTYRCTFCTYHSNVNGNVLFLSGGLTGANLSCLQFINNSLLADLGIVFWQQYESFELVMITHCLFFNSSPQFETSYESSAIVRECVFNSEVLMIRYTSPIGSNISGTIHFVDTILVSPDYVIPLLCPWTPTRSIAASTVPFSGSKSLSHTLQLPHSAPSRSQTVGASVVYSLSSSVGVSASVPATNCAPLPLGRSAAHASTHQLLPSSLVRSDSLTSTDQVPPSWPGSSATYPLTHQLLPSSLASSGPLASTDCLLPSLLLGSVKGPASNSIGASQPVRASLGLRGSALWKITSRLPVTLRLRSSDTFKPVSSAFNESLLIASHVHSASGDFIESVWYAASGVFSESPSCSASGSSKESIGLLASGRFGESRDFSASPLFGASGQVAASGGFWGYVVVPTVLKGSRRLSKSSGSVSQNFHASGLFSSSSQFEKTAMVLWSYVFTASNPVPAAAQAGSVSAFQPWMWILIAVVVLLVVAASMTIFCIVKRRERTLTVPEEGEPGISLDTVEDECHEYWNPFQSDGDEDSDPVTLAHSDGEDGTRLDDIFQGEPEVIPSDHEDPVASAATNEMGVKE